MGSHTPVVYTTDQFKWNNKNQLFYTDIESLTAKNHGKKNFKGKKKFIIKNKKTNFSLEYVYKREYPKAYFFKSVSKPSYACYVLKHISYINDIHNLSPVRFLKLYHSKPFNTDIFYMHYNGFVYTLHLPNNILGKNTYGNKYTMRNLYKNIGIKRYLTISIQDCLDKGFCFEGISKYLTLSSFWFPYTKQFRAWGEKCPKFILQHKVTFNIYSNKSYLYKKFKDKVRFCPTEKLLLKKGLYLFK